MAELINAIIAIGGTTAYEEPFDAASMDAAYISCPSWFPVLWRKRMARSSASRPDAIVRSR